jgi:hypothetical protein
MKQMKQMKQINPRPVLIAAILSVLAAVVGCQEQSGAAKRDTARPRDAKPSPEESFALILETFRRGVEDVPIGFIAHDAEGHSMMTGRNEVSHELIRPAKEGDPYKAIITVASQSRYSIQRSTSEEEVDEQTDEQQDSLAEQGDEGDLEIFDRDLISRSSQAKQDRRTSPSAADGPDKTIARQADRQERKYELLYQDGKWQRITELDPETEQSIENAFKRALAMQN